MRALLIATAALLAAGCQGFGSGVDGSWASDDGVFVATFDNGAFTSRLTTTGETVVADGRYQRTANGVDLSWVSIAANENRSASCTYVASNQLSCSPSMGQPFTMTRA